MGMIINEEDKRLKKLLEIEATLKRHKENNLFIWGFSQTAKMVTAFCEKNSELKVKAYVVDDAYYPTKETDRQNVWKATEWREKVQAGDFVVFGFTNARRAEELKKSLPKEVTGIYFHFPYSANVDGSYLNYDYYLKHKNEFEKIYEVMQDQLSKEIMEAFLNGCISGETEVLESLKTDGQYFNELTETCNPGCLVDLGAYVGDTIERAAEFYKERLQKVVSFEPDLENIEVLKRKVQEIGFPKENLELVIKGSWSEEKTLHFSSSNSSSSICSDGDIEIQVDSVDHVLEKNQIPVSYLKMDVEGSEKETLLGAEETIRKFHPILAVCVYHKMEDLFELTNLIKKIAGNYEYRYYLRYHGPDLRELVLYVIPAVLEKK